MIIEHFLGIIIPYLAALLETAGVIVIVMSSVGAIRRLIAENLDYSKDEIKIKLSKGLALALEFKLGAEIIKTILIRSLDEFYILAAVTIMRMLIGFVIHSEVKSQHDAMNEGQDEKKEKNTEEKIKKVI